MSIRPHSLHHTNVPMKDLEKTERFYTSVFGLKRVPAKTNTRILLLTNGNFDLHFTPYREEKFPRLKPLHFAVEVEDWDDFMSHLDALGIYRTKTHYRPENDSRFCYIHDPNGNMIELVYHGKLHENLAPTA